MHQPGYAELATTCHQRRSVRDVLRLGQIGVQPKILLHSSQKQESGNAGCQKKVLRQYLEKHGHDAATSMFKAYKIEDIDICPDLPPSVKERILSLCRSYKEVFLKNNRELPRPVLAADGKPYVCKIEFKKGYKPVRCRAPKYPRGSATRTVLEAWTEKSLQSGLIVPATNSQWASRVLTVAKYDLNEERGGIPDSLRIVSDFVAANEQKVPFVPIFQHAHLEMQRVAGHKYYFQADAAKGYWQFLLDRPSSDSTAVWLPHRGATNLFRFTRCVMGDVNSGSWMNSRFSEALANDVCERGRDLLSNLADDFVGWGDTPDELLFALEALLKMCRKSHLTLNSKKIKIGYRNVEYWGFNFNERGTQPSERNLSPVRQLQIPKTRKELMSVLGLFNVFSHFLKDEETRVHANGQKYNHTVYYSELVAPLQELNKGPYKSSQSITDGWGPTQQEAFDKVRGLLLAGVGLHAPLYDRPLRLCTDACDFGYGACLFQDRRPRQLADPPDWSVPPDTPKGEDIQVIRMWSKAWTPAQRKLPVYFRESLGWCYGVLKSRPYVLSSRFPLLCQTDHQPLSWVRKSSGKAAISSFLTDKIADVNWKIYYLPGSLNH